jgi:hypothetical protein
MSQQPFAMSKYVSMKDLFEDKAKHYQDKCEKLEAALLAISRAYSDWAMNVSDEDERLINELINKAETK